jgi:hypothetical protein
VVVHNPPMLITVAGVPAHPLLVHAVVVLIPLAAIGAVLPAVRPSWNRPYGILVAALALAGAVAATLARLAGDQLEAAIDVTAEFAPVIAQHASYGLFTMISAWPFAVLALGAAVLARRPSTSAVRAVGALSAIAGLVAVAATVLAGHSGSAAVWGYVTA